MRHARLSGLVSAGLRTRSLALLSATALVGATLAGLTTRADAQPVGKIQHTSQAPPADDGLGPRDMLLSADTLEDNHDTKTVTAIGHVEARMGGRTLRADKVIYNTVTGVAHATGHAMVMNADGTSEYGEDVLLDDQFRAAVAYGFAMREQGNITIVAGDAVRRNETIDQLNNAAYTACAICKTNGAPKNPTWNIQASRIIQDRDNHVIYYRNAVIRILGVPIFYSPVFWHPDPSAPARSGLLAPKIEYSSRRGFSYEQPYAQILSPSADLIVSPQFNTRVNPFLNMEYTQRTYSGLFDIRAGVTDSQNFDSHTFFDHESVRSYILAQGKFQIDPYWDWGFGAERVSDPTLFARYGVHDVYTDRGPYPTDTNSLISQIYTTRQDQNTFVSIAAMDFENIAAYGRVPGVTTTSSTGVVTTGPEGGIIGASTKAYPVVAPLIEARYDPIGEVLDGTFSIKASTVALSRGNTVLNVNDPTAVNAPGAQVLNATTLAAVTNSTALAGNKGVTALSYRDYRRVSTEADWRSTFTLDNGIRIEPFLVARGDLYSISDSTLYRFSGTSSAPTTSAGEDTVGRGLATVGATVSWPFVRNFGSSSLVLEPTAQILIAPSLKANPYIPNEDSVSFEYDETNLFSVNRFAGYDLEESGQRLNVGGRATLDWGTGLSASAIVGRTFRAEPDVNFTEVSGLRDTASDWVTAINVTPFTGVSLFTRARLDADSLSLRRDETGINFAIPRGFFSLRYDYNQSGYSVQQTTETVNGVTTQAGQTVIGLTQDATIGAQTFFTKNWGIGANVSRDLEHSVFPVAQLDLIYQDDCIRVDVLYTHDETYGTVLGTSNAITFRLTLATLGDSGSAPQSRQGSR
ncbi:MAG: LPS-assembly protein LptD [Caulobacteraceae bacterium]